MKKQIEKHGKWIAAAALAVCMSTLCIMADSIPAKAENPIVQTMYTADPSPLVVGDTMYVYTTRDEHRESATKEWSLMNEWRCFSTKDMINWTDHGQIAHAETFDGEGNWRAWAQHVVTKPVTENGVTKNKYYLFAPFNGTKIDVAVSDNPWGPFEDATPGKYLIDGGWDGGNIDPAVLVEDHGNPDDVENYDYYLYWGNPYLRYCKLTDDLLDVDPDTDGDGILSEEESQIDPRFSKNDNKILGEVRPGLHSFQTHGDEGYASFGEPTQGVSTTGKFPAEPASSKDKRSAFEEGPWLIKHDDGKEGTDDYFLFFVGGRTPGETVEYSTAPSPIGPWTYRGLVMDRENGYSCIHPGVVEFKGKNYLFYLNEMLVGGNGSDRSVCVKEFSYDENNLIVKETDEKTAALLEQGMKDKTKGTPYFSVNAIGTLNPYELNQAETICWASNLDGVTGGFNGTGQGVKTKAKETITKDKDPVTGKVAFWQSAAKFGVVVCDIDNNDYIKVANVDFGETRTERFTVSAACGKGLPPTDLTEDNKGNMIFNPDCDTVSGNIELWLDYGTDNECQIGTVTIGNTGDTNIYQDFTTELTGDAVGIHDLYFIFRGEENAKLFNLDTWQFTKKEVPKPTQTPAVPTTAPPSAPNQPAVTAQPSTAPNIGTTPSPGIKKPARTKITKVKKKGKTKCLISLKKTANAAGYQIEYSTDKAFKKNVKKVTVKKPSCTIKKLRSGKKYYFRARAFVKSSGKIVYGAYSSVKSKKQKTPVKSSGKKISRVNQSRTHQVVPPLVVRDISNHFPNISLKERVLYVIIKVTYFVEKKGKVIYTMKKIISTKDAPAAIGPYSQAIEINGFLFTSGVIPIIPSTGELATGGIEAQAEQALSNLAALIHASGARIEDTVKTTVFIKNMDDFAAVNDIYAKYFTKDFPARSCVEVARLPKDVLIEIEAIVEKKETM